MRTFALLLILVAIAASQPHHWLVGSHGCHRPFAGQIAQTFTPFKRRSQKSSWKISYPPPKRSWERRFEWNDHRDWAIFWCPFHNDASREGARRSSQLRRQPGQADTGSACAAAPPVVR